MMFAKTLAATPWGIEARPVEVEIDVRGGLPKFQLVGLPDTAVRESRERVEAALRNWGFELPARSVTVNLAPADLRKEGNYLDLAIAVTWLAGLELIPARALEGRMICGELALDGAVRSVRGAISIAAAAAARAVREVLLPAESAAQAAALGEIDVIPIASIGEAVGHLAGTHRLSPLEAGSGSAAPERRGTTVDLADVRGHNSPRRALEIAAAGGHNLLMVGPPGTGKTLLARALPGILPPLSRRESITATKIHSFAGDGRIQGLLSRRPFRAPHTSVSLAGLIGGGSSPRPGEVSLAHAGVLFLDELPEFQRAALEALRQPLEEGRVTVVRARDRATFPASFSLVAAMNPCPCGYFGDSRNDCRCSEPRRNEYRSRISGPLLDRIDLQVEVHRISLESLRNGAGESSGEVGLRVLAARSVQEDRQEGRCNAALSGPELDVRVPLEEKARLLLDRAYERLGVSLRTIHRIRRVARTIADLEGAPGVLRRHVAEALHYRLPERPGTD